MSCSYSRKEINGHWIHEPKEIIILDLIDEDESVVDWVMGWSGVKNDCSCWYSCGPLSESDAEDKTPEVQKFIKDMNEMFPEKSILLNLSW